MCGLIGWLAWVRVVTRLELWVGVWGGVFGRCTRCLTHYLYCTWLSCTPGTSRLTARLQRRPACSFCPTGCSNIREDSVHHESFSSDDIGPKLMVNSLPATLSIVIAGGNAAPCRSSKSTITRDKSRRAQRRDVCLDQRSIGCHESDQCFHAAEVEWDHCDCYTSADCWWSWGCPVLWLPLPPLDFSTAWSFEGG